MKNEIISVRRSIAANWVVCVLIEGKWYHDFYYTGYTKREAMRKARGETYPVIGGLRKGEAQ